MKGHIQDKPLHVTLPITTHYSAFESMFCMTPFPATGLSSNSGGFESMFAHYQDHSQACRCDSGL